MLPPFNIELLIPTAKDLVNVPRVEVLDIFDGSTKNFHRNGLFSQENFGRPGEEKRSRLYGYIDLKLKIMHPLIYSMLTNMKSLYEGIMKSTEYAVFDNKIKDFVKSNPIDGKTGYEYFASNLLNIKFEGRDSDKREISIDVLDKYKEVIFFDKCIVMPPGLRDYSVDENGKPSEDDINKLYRKILSTANMVASVNKSANPEHLDSMRISMQLGIVEVYKYIIDMLDGKNKFMMGKFTTRKIYRSTRNVITAYSPKHDNLLSPRNMSTNDTGVGLQQYVTACIAQIGKVVKEEILSEVFTGPNTPSSLIHTTTLKKQLVRGTEEYYDRWMTITGLEKVAEEFGIEELRHDYVMIGDYYAALIYKGQDSTFKILYDIDDLPEHLDKKYVTPLTYAELFYIAAYKMAKNTPGTVTRYPITGYGSVYPCTTYLISTNVADIKYRLNDEWEKTEEVAPEFPIYKEPFFNSLSLSTIHLARAGADHDGDVVNWIPVFTDEAKEEVYKLLASAKYYVGFDGNMFFSASDDISSLVVAHLFN